MQAYERTNLREELDEALLPFRLVRKRKGKPRDGWVRGIREAIGLPVEELARRVGVQRWEIHRIEKSEQSQRVMLSTLKRAAEGLGCEVVYALVPKEGTLKEMAREQEAAREEALEKRRAARERGQEEWAKFIGWEATFFKTLQMVLRKEGYRVRPRKTNRGDEQKIRDFEQGLRAMQLAGMLGPFMQKFLEEQEKRKREREGAIEEGGGSGSRQH